MHMKTSLLLIFSLLIAATGCRQDRHDVVLEPGKTCECPPGDLVAEAGKPFKELKGALMATRFSSLEDLKRVVTIKYGSAHVQLAHCSAGLRVTSVLEAGVSEKDLVKARDGGFFPRLGMVFKAPFAIANRLDMQRVGTLARKRAVLFGEGDVAFFNLAEIAIEHIDPEDDPFAYAPDSSEKGYINTFNHITAQAMITTIFSEELADFMADVHELKNMGELVSGDFTEEQLTDPDNNPVDNYVDVINNEWGQELGKRLRWKYGINRETHWTPELLADYLNDLQAYFGWSLEIGFEPFRAGDEEVVKFARKINRVMSGEVV